MAELQELILQYFIFLLSITCFQPTTSQETCRLHDIRGVSEGTQGFPTVFQIAVLEGQADLHLHSSRQVLIPAMNFNCSGVITKWIFPARWDGNTDAYLQLQVWRRLSTLSSSYYRIGSTTVQAREESRSRVYEVPLSPPMLFQAGDIVGYFQPDAENAQLNLYLEDSEIITTYRDNVDDDLTEPVSNVFDLDSVDFTGDDYPLIAVETDPPNCVCGTVSLERINTLLNTDREGFAPKNIFPQEQAIFPNINFTASGRLLRWIVGGTYMNNNPAVFPEVQLWRPTGDTTYQKLNGTTVIAPVEIRRGIYEFPLDRPLTFQAGDVLGLFQPPLLSSRLLVDYDTQDHPTTYYIPLNDDQVQPFHTLVDISEWQTGSILPLVSVVIVLDDAATTTVVTRELVTTPTPETTPAPQTTLFQPSPTATPTTTPSTSLQPTTTPLVTLPGSQQPSTTETFDLDRTPTAGTIILPSTSPAPLVSPTELTPPSVPLVSPVESIPMIDVVNSASSTGGPTQGLMFYIGLGVVGALLAMILLLIVVLVIVAKSPRRRTSKNPPTPAIHINPESANSAGYELYTDVPDAPSSVEPQSPSNTQPQVFDDPIYHAPDPQKDLAACFMLAQIKNQHTPTPNDAQSTIPTISAYAISNVHCSTNRALPTVQEQSDDYDYADP